MVGIPATSDDRYRWLLDTLYRRELFGIKLGLGNTRRMLTALGRPEREFPAILVAGTNGKGSTAAMIAAILRESGVRVGLFTSPHLLDYRERIRVDGAALSPDELVELALPLLPLLEECEATYFEAAAVLAFTHFARKRVGAAVVEVGLGGRLDATNVLPRPLAVVTDIDRDHQERLGSTLPAIAWEKAGIIRRGGEVISGCRRPTAARVIRRVARRREAKLRELEREAHFRVRAPGPGGARMSLMTETGRYRDLQLSLVGSHQARNAAVAVMAAESWAAPRGGLDPSAVARGLRRVRWPGRWERVAESPVTLVDVAHNPSGARALAEILAEVHPGERPVLVFGSLAGKDYRRMLNILLPLADRAVFTEPATSRSIVAASELARLARRLGVPSEEEPVVARAVRVARERGGPRGMVLITGSGYLVAEAMSSLGATVPERI